MIKLDIEMPVYCSDCPCHDGENGRCKITRESAYDKRPFDCPLKEEPVADAASTMTRGRAMTRERAIECLMDMEFNCDASYDKEALQLAIEALKREQQLLDAGYQDAGYQNAAVNFYIDGRLFRAREIA